jgi:multicomponent Na+:H+ antiporter subunit C
MFNLFLGHYGFWLVIIMMTIGLYGMMAKKNLIKKLIGMSIFQVAIIIFFVASASKFGGTVPVMDKHIGTADAALYINPLPHTLMLTAIVVGVATMGVAFALVISIFKRYKTLEEDELLQEMKKENDTANLDRP